MSVFKPTDEPGVLMTSWTLASPKTEFIACDDALFMAVDRPILSLNTLGGRDFSQYQFYKTARVNKPVEVEGVWTVICKDLPTSESLGVAVLKDFNEYRKTGEWGDHYSNYVRNDRVALEPGSVILMPVSGDDEMYALSPFDQDMHQLRRVNLEPVDAQGTELALKLGAQPIRSTNLALTEQFDFIDKQWPDDGSAIAHKADIRQITSLVKRGFMDGLSLA